MHPNQLDRDRSSADDQLVTETPVGEKKPSETRTSKGRVKIANHYETLAMMDDRADSSRVSERAFILT